MLGIVTPGDFDIDGATASRLLGRPLRMVARLTGGEHAVTTALTDGVDEYVLRRFPPGDPAVRREVSVLPRLTVLGRLAPRLIAYDESDDAPAILTNRLPGTTPAPDADLALIAHRLADVLARVHTVDATGLRPAPVGPPAGHDAIIRRARQDWTELDMATRVLTHFDFWSGNCLWDGDTVTGVVDWSGARHAPRGVDLAWCRLDLILLGGRGAADLLLAEYGRASGRPVDDIASWDRQAAAQAHPVVEHWAANYAGIGRPELTGPVLRQRLETWIDELLG